LRPSHAGQSGGEVGKRSAFRSFFLPFFSKER
jgi:hypothetical protein